MKNIRTYLFLVLLTVLAACAPRAVPAAPEVVYEAPAPDVYAAVVRAISTSPGIPNSNGWIIDQSDSAGGFVSAQTSISGYRLIGGPYNETHSVSVVVSPNSPERTAVVVQFTPEAAALAQRIRETLTSQFGQPISAAEK